MNKCWALQLEVNVSEKYTFNKSRLFLMNIYTNYSRRSHFIGLIGPSQNSRPDQAQRYAVYNIHLSRAQCVSSNNFSIAMVNQFHKYIEHRARVVVMQNCIFERICVRNCLCTYQLNYMHARSQHALIIIVGELGEQHASVALI